MSDDHCANNLPKPEQKLGHCFNSNASSDFSENPPTNVLLTESTTHFRNGGRKNLTFMKRCDQQCFGQLLSLDNYLPMFEEIIGQSLPEDAFDYRHKNASKISDGDDRTNDTVEFDFSKVGSQREPIKDTLNRYDSFKMISDNPSKLVEEMTQLYRLECSQRRQLHKTKRSIDQLRNYSTGIMNNRDTFDESVLLASPKTSKIDSKQSSSNKTTLPITSSTQEASALNCFISTINTKERKGDNEFVPETSRKRRKKHFLGSDGSLLLQCDTDGVRFRFYCDFISKAISKVQRYRNSVRVNLINTKRKVDSYLIFRRRSNALSKKSERDFHIRAKKVFKEVCNYGKRKAKAAHSNKKKKEQEAIDNQKQQIQYKEMKRQQRKLNYLITQTELFSHFMGLKNPQDSSSFDVDNDELAKILSILDEDENTSDNKTSTLTTSSSKLTNENDQYDVNQAKSSAMESIRKAVEKQNLRLSQYQNPNTNNANMISTDEYFQQQNIIFNGKLKGYQLKGVSWLSTLYDKGFNGILADEMGLGKTVQTMSFLSYLAETRNLWGPFLIISPSSTLHNWQQEFTKFVPEFTVLPYWGTGNERKLLRSFWNSKKKFLQSRHDAPFHVLITSYQLIVRDVQFFTKLNWQYMVLDEAQAIKSSNSQRWKKLLSFKCRNRLLLTGTPMQNTMAELWSLLHFIMPVLFDSHDEFNEWFSKDIEGRVENKAAVDETHLSRLHMVLQPFMLRRTKKEVEKELTDKIEILVSCGLSLRQKFLYQIIREELSSKDIMDAMDRKIGAANKASMINSYKKLMNLVVQFRKVCNHPDLFENRYVYSPLYVKPIEYALPSLFLDHQTCLRSSPLISRLFNVFSPKNITSQLFEKDSNFGSIYYCRVNADVLDKCYQSLLYRFQHYLYQLFVHQPQLYLEENNIQLTHDVSIRPQSNALINLMIWPSFKLSAIQRLADFSALLSGLAIIRNNTNVSPCGIVKINPVCTFLNVKSDPLDENNQLMENSSNQNVFKEENKIFTLESTFEDSLRTYPNIILSAFCKKVTTAPPQIKMISKRATVHKANMDMLNKQSDNFLINGHDMTSDLLLVHTNHWSYNPKLGFSAICPPQGWSNVIKSDPSELIVDSDKMLVLHSLLSRLKSQGHRVLIYSQMTKMIDILENYLIRVKHKYVRLDGSSKMADRRETVSDFQTNTDIFVFLLSTRAGGVGINLTAADTVIFYDSDWNPTVDQQAMDRAHRLGQTRQVTVYRLICAGTVEERILQRANQKSLVQQMIISGKDKNKSLKPKEIVALLLDENELQQRMKSRRETANTDRRKNKSVAKKGPTIKSLAALTKKNNKRQHEPPNILDAPNKQPKVN